MARIKLSKFQEREYQAVKDTLVLRNRREYLISRRILGKPIDTITRLMGNPEACLKRGIFQAA